VKGKMQKQLKPKQRQPEHLVLLSRAYLSFAGSFFMLVFVIFNLGAKYRINFYLCKKNVFK